MLYGRSAGEQPTNKQTNQQKNNSTSKQRKKEIGNHTLNRLRSNYDNDRNCHRKRDRTDNIYSTRDRNGNTSDKIDSGHENLYVQKK